MSLSISSGIQPMQNLAVLQHVGDDKEKREEWGHHFINKGFHSEFAPKQVYILQIK